MRRASTVERRGGGKGARGLESEGGRAGEREERAGSEPEEREEGCSTSGSMGEASDSEPCFCSSGGERDTGANLFKAEELNLPQQSSVI